MSESPQTPRNQCQRGTKARSDSSKGKETAPPADAPASTGEANPPILPTDATTLRQLAKYNYLDVVAAAVLKSQCELKGLDPATAEKVSLAYVESLQKSIKPRDAVEEMLVLQMAWTHGRLGHMSSLATQQTSRENIRTVHDACDRAANTYRRQMLALAEYRRPARSDNFTVVKQANVANQQLVNNAQDPNSAKPIASNELGSTPALPHVAEGIEFPAPVRPESQALAAEHRPEDAGRQSPLGHERLATR